jgi:hypothetical protein
LWASIDRIEILGRKKNGIKEKTMNKLKETCVFLQMINPRLLYRHMEYQDEH